MSEAAAGWFAAGKTLGVAVDLDAGTLRVSVDGADWAVAFQAGCAPGAAVGAGLFPALSGSDGARVRCNWGADESRPMRHAPPASEYRAVGLLQQQKVRAVRSVPLCTFDFQEPAPHTEGGRGGRPKRMRRACTAR